MGASKELIDGLNHALNREVSTMLRYLLQAALIKGVQWEPVRAMYREEITDELEHARYLAEKIAILGGTPTLNLDLTPPPSEPAAMLQRDIEEERQDVRHYLKMAELADRDNQIELKLRMEDQAADEARHAEEMLRLLG